MGLRGILKIEAEAQRQRHKTKTQHTRGKVFEGEWHKPGKQQRDIQKWNRDGSDLKTLTYRAELHTLKYLNPLRKIILL